MLMNENPYISFVARHAACYNYGTLGNHVAYLKCEFDIDVMKINYEDSVYLLKLINKNNNLNENVISSVIKECCEIRDNEKHVYLTKSEICDIIKSLSIS